MNTDFLLDKITQESRYTRELRHLLQNSLHNRLFMSQARRTRHFARSLERREEEKRKLLFFSPLLVSRFAQNAAFASLGSKRVCFRPVKRATSKDFVAKKDRTTLYFLQQIFAICNNLNCCKIGLNVASETRNIAIKLVLQ